MEKVMILYGWGGSLPPHWQDWLARELVSKHYMVCFPKLQHRYSPKRHQWMEKTKRYIEVFRPDTVICHSLGSILWLHLCEEGNIPPVKRLLLVTPPYINCDIPDIASFFPAPVPKTLKAEESLLVASTNDHYMSEEEAIKLQESLGIPMKIFENVGHINEKSGFGPWPFAFEWVTGNPWKEFDGKALEDFEAD